MDNKIKRTLLETGLPWRAAPARGGTLKIFLAGKLVGVTADVSSAKDLRGVRNIQAQIKRTARELKGTTK